MTPQQLKKKKKKSISRVLCYLLPPWQKWPPSLYAVFCSVSSAVFKRLGVSFRFVVLWSSAFTEPPALESFLFPPFMSCSSLFLSIQGHFFAGSHWLLNTPLRQGVYVLHHCDKVPNKKQLSGERVCPACCWRGLSTLGGKTARCQEPEAAG